MFLRKTKMKLQFSKFHVFFGQSNLFDEKKNYSRFVTFLSESKC